MNVLELNLALDDGRSLRRMARGTLRIYLGAAPGVGKTFAMLGRGPARRRARGTDVVVGVVETHGRRQTADADRRPRGRAAQATLEYRGTTFEEMDVDAVLARRPEVALVDELAHTNVPGSRNEKRWQDVEELLDAGINVISTLNIQHLESLNDVVEQITGIKQRETIPDDVVRRADQIELVDMAPEAIRRRMAHGNIYPAERIDAALGNYFRPGNLGALRELACSGSPTASTRRLADYRERHGIEQPVGDARARRRRADRLRRTATGSCAGRPGWHYASQGRPGRRPRAPAGRPRWRRLPICSTSSASSSSSSAAPTARSSAPTSAEALVERRADAERDPDRARRDPPLALARADAGLGDQPRDPRAPASASTSTSSAATRERPDRAAAVAGRGGPAALPRRRVAARLRCSRRSGCRC